MDNSTIFNEETKNQLEGYIQSQDPSLKVSSWSVSESGRVDLKVADANDHYVTVAFYPEDTESMNKALVYFPATKGSYDSGCLRTSSMNSKTGECSPTPSVHYDPNNVANSNGTVTVPGFRDVIENDQINHCVSVAANDTSSVYPKMTSTVLDAVQSTYGGEKYDQVVVTSASAGASLSSEFISNYSDKAGHVTGAYFDSAFDAAFLNKPDLINKDNVDIICFEARVNHPTVAKAQGKAAWAATQGLPVLIAQNADEKIGEHHYEPIYTALRNRNQINAMLEGQLISPEENYELSWWEQDSKGRLIKYSVDANTVNYINDDSHTDEEKYMYYQLRTNASYDMSKISVEYQPAFENLTNLYNYIANHSEPYAAPPISNENFGGLFKKATPLLESSNLLNYRVKQGVFATTAELADLAITERQLSEEAMNLQFGFDNGFTAGSIEQAAQEKVFSSYQVLAGTSEYNSKFLPNQVGAISLDDIKMMENTVINRLGDEQTQAKDMSSYLANFIADPSISGASFDGMREKMEEFKGCMDDRYIAAGDLKDAYQRSLTMMANYMDQNGRTSFDDSNYNEMKNTIIENNKQIAYLAEKAKICVMEYHTYYDEFGSPHEIAIPTYPYKAECEAAIEALQEINTYLQGEIDYIDGFIVVLHNAEKIIDEANQRVEQLFVNEISYLPDIVPLVGA